MKKRKVFKVHPYRKYALFILLFFFFVGIGYSLLNTDLNIFGSVSVSRFDKTLYGIFEKKYGTTETVKKYTKKHQESMDSSKSNKDIYYFYYNSSNSTANVVEPHYVIFANMCWKMLRTTDTGGVKLLYYGEAENNQCLDTRENHVGFSNRSIIDLSQSYYYGSQYVYDKENNLFSLSGSVIEGTWNDTNYSDYIGKYTCLSNEQNGTCSQLYYIESYATNSSAYAYVVDNTVNFSTVGFSAYNAKNSSLASLGYMYNKEYDTMSYSYNPSQHKLNIVKYQKYTDTFYYADEYDYNNINENQYTLVNPTTISPTDYASLVGKYTLLSLDGTTGSNQIYYVAKASGTYLSLVTLSNGQTVDDLDYYSYGSSYKMNADGTFTIDDPQIFYAINWKDDYSKIRGKYICKNTDGTCTELWRETQGTTSNTGITYHIVDEYPVFAVANSAQYIDGVYYLDDTKELIRLDGSDYMGSILKNKHYTCFNESGECTSLSFIHYKYYVNDTYYINLTNGEFAEDALTNMLNAEDINTTNSTIKNIVDAWYEQNLIDYSSYLDDVIYCSQRNVYSYGGWLQGTNEIDDRFTFPAYYGSIDYTLTCQLLDSYSVSNDKARLKYPVGLLSYADPRSSAYLNTGTAYWYMSPASFVGISSGKYVRDDGLISNSSYSNAYGVNPTIVLKAGTEYSSGTGSMEDPYIVKMN